MSGTRVTVTSATGAVGALTVVGAFPGRRPAVRVLIERLAPRGAVDHSAWVDSYGHLVKLEDALTPIDLELLVAGVHELLEVPHPTEEITA